MTDVSHDETSGRSASAVLLRHFLVYVTLSTAAIGQPLLQLYGDNLTVFTTARFDGPGVLGFMLLVLLAVPVAFSCVEALVTAMHPRSQGPVHTSFVYVLALTFVLALTRSVPIGSWVAHVVLAGIMAAGFVWLFHRFGAIRTWASMMSPLVVLVGASFTLAVRDVVWTPSVGAVEIQDGTSVPPRPGTPPEDVSVIWLVLDEAPLYPLLDKDGNINAERFPGFAALAGASTWYRDAVSPSQTTTDALPSMLSGTVPRIGASPILANYERNLFTLMNTRMAFDVREFTTSLCPESACTGVPDIAVGQTGSTVPGEYVDEPIGRPFDLGGFLKDSVVVLGHKILPEGLRGNLPPIDESWGGFADGGGGGIESPAEVVGDEVEDTADDTAADPGADDDTQQDRKRDFRETGPSSLIPPFERMVARASNSLEPALHFQHIMLPHRPWKLTPDHRSHAGALNPARVKDVSVPDNATDVHVLNHEYQALLMQYAAVDKMMGHMVSQLKASNAWDRTMIVVVADHGISMESGTTRRRVVDADKPGTWEDLYRVPLFIKYPDQREAQTNDCDVMSYDILPTVAAAKNLDAGWVYDGVDLATSCPDRPAREVSWPDGKIEMTSDWRSLLGRVSLYDGYVPVAGGLDGIYGFGPFSSLVGTTVGTTMGATSIGGWRVDQLAEFADVSDARFSTVPAQITGTITVSRDIPAGSIGIVTLNGKVAAVLDELQGARAGTEVAYRAMLATSQLTSGRHTIGVTVVSGSAGDPVFEPVQQPKE